MKKLHAYVRRRRNFVKNILKSLTSCGRKRQGRGQRAHEHQEREHLSEQRAMQLLT